jgi:hypothetical protein
MLPSRHHAARAALRVALLMVSVVALAPAQSRPLTGALAAPAAPASAAEAVEIRPGHAAIRGSAITPGTRTMRLVLVRNGVEQQIGTMTDQIVETTVGGKPAFRRVKTVTSPTPGVANSDTTVWLRDGFAPVSYRGGSATRTTVLDFAGATVTGTVTVAGTAQPVNLTADVPVFDSNVLDVLMRALPLAEGYAVKVPIYLHEAGGRTWITARVTDLIQADVDGARRDVWVVRADPMNRPIVQWITRDTRELLGTVVQVQPGVELRVVR